MKQLFTAKDKQKHIIAGFLISAVVGVFTTWWIGLMAATVIGAGKELYDMTGRGTPEWMDLVATIIGGILGLVVSLPW